MMDLALILISAALGLTVVIALYLYQVSFMYVANWFDGDQYRDSDLNSMPS